MADKKRLLFQGLQLFFGICLVLVMLKLLDFKDGGRLLSPAGWAIAGSLLTSLAANAFAATRWRYALGAVKTENPPSLPVVFKVHMAGATVGQAVASGGLNLAYQTMLYKKQHGDDVGSIAQSLMIDRVLDVLLFSLITACSLFYALKLISAQASALLATIAMAAALALTLVFPESARQLCMSPQYLARQLYKGVRAGLLLLGSAAAARQAPEKSGEAGRVAFSPALLMILSLLQLAGFILRNYYVALAYGFDLPLYTLVVGMSVMFVSRVISITPGGLGVGEFGWAAILMDYGLAQSDAAMVSIAFRIYEVIFTVGAYVLAWTLAAAWRRVRSADAA